jgi:hypothetical protein
MTSQRTIGRCGYSLDYSADELHERIIDDLRAWCEHRGRIDIVERFLESDLQRPIEQTIRGVLAMAESKGDA